MATSRFMSIVNGVKQLIVPLQTSAGVASAGQIPALNANGLIDTTMMPTASTTALGAVKVDGTTIKITSGVIATVSAGSTGSPFVYKYNQNQIDQNNDIKTLPTTGVIQNFTGSSGSVAGNVLNNGLCLTVEASGVYTTTGTTPLLLSQVTFGGKGILTNNGLAVSDGTGLPWRLQFMCQIRSGGTNGTLNYSAILTAASNTTGGCVQELFGQSTAVTADVQDATTIQVGIGMTGGVTGDTATLQQLAIRLI